MHVDYRDVPLALDLVRLSVYSASPSIAADRLAALRKGFVDTLRDPAFEQEVEKMDLEVSQAISEELLKNLQASCATAPALV
jgi:hypothetical protein